MDRLVLEDFHEISVIPLGGDLVLFKSSTDGVLSAFCEFIKASKFFSKLASSFGELVCIDDRTLREVDLVKGRICVNIPVSSSCVNEVVNVSTKEGCFHVRVLEEFWVTSELPMVVKDSASSVAEFCERLLTGSIEALSDHFSSDDGDGLSCDEDVRHEGQEADIVVCVQKDHMFVQRERETDKEQLSGFGNNLKEKAWDGGNHFSALATLGGDVDDVDGESERSRAVSLCCPNPREGEVVPFLGEQKNSQDGLLNGPMTCSSVKARNVGAVNGGA
ncbi:hypothetical protein TSUD_291100 [Trifolium subterraneum]|uniref:Uncharacterized protein n=1 Tax=Trifolium subterraneum TaxID=3900 RepID=A0A1B5Z8P7_TRISU|nr:hypothetical protein TSUD_291100 [Trifolium subterraneum]